MTRTLMFYQLIPSNVIHEYLKPKKRKLKLGEKTNIGRNNY